MLQIINIVPQSLIHTDAGLVFLLTTTQVCDNTMYVTLQPEFQLK